MGSSPWARPKAIVRATVAVGVLLQFVAWLMNIVLFPSAVITMVAGVTGARRVGRDDDEAVLRLGVALVTSSVASVLSVFSGALVFVLVAWTSSALLGIGWWQMRGLATARRRSWGVRQQDMLLRRRELEQRQQRLHDRRED